MPKKIQLSIPKPCHEDWDAMSPVEKGKFCGSCQKQVVDFSGMSDRQVAEFFKKPSTGSVCGRFMADQLERDIEIPKKRIPWVKYFFSIALPAFFVSIKASASKTQGEIKLNRVAADTTRKRIYDDVKMMGMVSRPQSIRPFMGDTIVAPVKDTVVKSIDPVCTEPMKGKPSIETRKGEIQPTIVKTKRNINGIVTNQNGEAVIAASIKSKKTGVFCDNNGGFKISVMEGDTLIASCIGYESAEIVVGKENSVMIRMMQIGLPEIFVGIIAVKKPGKKPAKKNLVILPKKQQSNQVTINQFKVFPNPLTAGSGITIEWKQTEESYYNLELVNHAGQTIHQKEIWIDADARLLNFDTPVVAAGSYFLVLTNKKTGKKFSEKIIIQ